MKIYAKVIFSSGARYYSEESESVTIDSVVTQFEGRLSVEGFTQSLSLGEYQSSGYTLNFRDLDGSIRAIFSTENVAQITVILMVRNSSGVLLTTSPLFQGKVDRWGNSENTAYLVVTDSTPEILGGRFLPLVESSRWPNAVAGELGRAIALGVGSMVTANSFPWQTSDGDKGLVRCSRVNDPGNRYYLIYDGPDDSGMSDAYKLYRGTTEILPSPTRIRDTYTKNGVSCVTVYVSYNPGTPPDYITADMDFTLSIFTYVLDSLNWILQFQTGTPIVDTSSARSAAFDLCMTDRGLTGASLQVAYQDNETIKQLVQDFCISTGSFYRVSRTGKIELIVVDGKRATVDHALVQSDIIFFQNTEFDVTKVTNDNPVELSYVPIRSKYTTQDAHTTPAETQSQVKYGYRSNASRVPYRWHYGTGINSITHGISKINDLWDIYPEAIVNFSAKMQSFSTLPLPGDIISLQHPDDFTYGTKQRYYFIYSLTNKLPDDIIDMVCRDITYIYSYLDRDLQLLIQATPTGATKFFNNSGWNCKEVYTYPTVTTVADAGALSGYAIRQSGSGRLWCISFTDGTEVLPKTNFTVSFRVKMSSIAANQTFMSAKNSINNDGWQIYFETANKRVLFDYVIGGVSVVTASSPNNSVNDTTNWHNIVFQKAGTGFQVFVDGVGKAPQVYAGTASSNAGELTILALRSLGLYSQYYTGLMDEISVRDGGNVFATRQTAPYTCTQKTIQETPFGIQGAWPVD